ncbi:octapeptide-repeat protein T2-like [Durio zibethinus]|uniref:Octapeptide-repeat protein T2-like n=1 Tax=Durio zibethinus TaxID=66656 RepID=A0A6P6A7H0_DURZI|nr:octapeptide-repeat protein T2-like [Durio zibethinus]
MVKPRKTTCHSRLEHGTFMQKRGKWVSVERASYKGRRRGSWLHERHTQQKGKKKRRKRGSSNRKEGESKRRTRKGLARTKTKLETGAKEERACRSGLSSVEQEQWRFSRKEKLGAEATYMRWKPVGRSAGEAENRTNKNWGEKTKKNSKRKTRGEEENRRELEVKSENKGETEDARSR